ncbi:hypothetical protein CL620_01625 [archaeon]|nr:hypothetical protein [archaeon]|tara:strand:- start:396 stop:887 length:492 start_codon:yes stop_codon:yes gene_type:complete
MDFISHGLWSYIFFHTSKRPWLAVVFGMVPDTMSWFIYGAYKILFEGGFGKPNLDQIPNWVWTLYGISHSLVVSLTVIAITFFIFARLGKELPYQMFAWPIAVTMDLLTHSADFLPTPFLWPISNYAFDGLPWSTPWFFGGYWVLIVGLLGWIIWKKRRVTSF